MFHLCCLLLQDRLELRSRFQTTTSPSPYVLSVNGERPVVKSDEVARLIGYSVGDVFVKLLHALAGRCECKTLHATVATSADC